MCPLQYPSNSQSDVVGGGRRHRAHALGAVFALGQLVGVVVGVEQLIRLRNNRIYKLSAVEYNTNVQVTVSGRTPARGTRLVETSMIIKKLFGVTSS